MARNTWGGIQAMEGGPSHKRHKWHHSQPVTSIVQKAQDDLTRLKLDEVMDDAELFRFRLSSERRLWGFRKGEIFHVLWWDPDHKVCPSKKSHT